MQPLRINKQDGELLRKIGAGRGFSLPDSALSLTYRALGGEGIQLSASINGARVRLWLDADQWCRWIAPVLVAPTWDIVPPGLYGALAAWTCASIGEALTSTQFEWIEGNAVAAASVALDMAWCLCVQRDGTKLEARVLEAPPGWLAQLADILPPLETRASLEPAAPPRTLPVSLITGWSRVDTATLKQLRPGDGLILHRASQIANGDLYLFLNRPLATVLHCDTGPYTIEVTMDEFNDWLDVEPAKPATNHLQYGDALIAVVAEVATIEIPLAQLAALQAGDILDGAIRTDGLVTLKAAGKPIARGMLLDIDGAIAVRIEHLM